MDYIRAKVGTAPDLRLKGFEFKSWQEWQENFILQC